MDVNTCNVVCAGTAATTIPMDRAARLPGATYQPESFPGVMVRASGYTARIFSSGKIIVVGAKTSKAAMDAVEWVAARLRRHGIHTGTIHSSIHNVVATANLGRPVNLAALSRHVPRTLYEPESFSGAILRRQNPRCTILLFASGSIVCAGSNSERAASDAIHQLDMELRGAGL